MVLANEFEQGGAELNFVTQPTGKKPEDKMLFGMKGLFAEYERAQILDRTQRGRLVRAHQGKLPGGLSSRLYGYDYLDGKRYINQEKAEIVQRIFNWFTEDKLPIGSIVSRLAAYHITSPSGNAYWSKTYIVNLLKNRAYIGETSIVFKASQEQVELPDATPAIIDKPVFNQAQVQLQANKELALRNTRREYLLRGYVYCQRCGRRYAGASRKTTKGNRIIASRNYRCGRQFDPSPSSRCKNRIWSADNLEAIAWRQVENVLSSPETVLAGIRTIESKAEQGDSIREELNKVNEHLKTLGREQEQLLQWAIRGFPEETIDKENERINQYRHELEQQRAKLEDYIATVKQMDVDIQGIKEACELVRNNLTELSFENKRLALEALSIKIRIDGEDINIEGSIPISDGSIVTTQSPRHLSLARLPCL